MKRFRTLSLCLVGLLAFAYLPSAVAGALNMAAGSQTVPTGTVNVDIPFTYTAAGNGAAGFGFEITYDSANLTATACAGTPSPLICDFTTTPGRVVYAAGGVSAIAGGVVLTLSFDASSAAAATYPIAFDPVNPVSPPGGPRYTDAVTFTDIALPFTDGAITVQAGPGPGVMAVAPPNVPLVNTVNGPASTQALTISNNGALGDSTLTASCSLGGVTAAPGVSLTVPAFNGMLAPGANTMVSASCSGTASGNANGTYTCDGGAAGMASSTVSCAVGAGVAIPDPPANSTVPLVIGPVVRGNSGNGNRSFSETANAGAGYDVTCMITSDPGAAFTLQTTGVQSVPPGGSVAIVVSGQSTATDPQPTGVMTCDYSNGAMGTVTVNLSIVIVAEIVPTLSQWGYILLILALVGFGGWSVRRRMNVA